MSLPCLRTPFLNCADNNPGLQIKLKDGTWIDVAPRQGALIINLGDMLERWTNGVYRSTPHRVLNTTGRERYSAPFFFEPNFTCVVECLDGCVPAGAPPPPPPPVLLLLLLGILITTPHLISPSAPLHTNHNHKPCHKYLATNLTTNTSPLATNTSPQTGEAPKYPPTTSGQHLLDKYNQTHCDFKQT